MNATAEMMGDFAFERVADRKAYRTVVQFPVTVQSQEERADVDSPVKAKPAIFSIGGMMLSMPEEFEKGTELELAFYLPFDHEAHDMTGKVVVEITPFGERRRSTSAPGRPVRTDSNARPHHQGARQCAQRHAALRRAIRRTLGIARG